jgi:uncharacterized metal-binding protein
MVVSLDGCPKVTSESETQPWNADFSITATDFGIRTHRNPHS